MAKNIFKFTVDPGTIIHPALLYLIAQKNISDKTALPRDTTEFYFNDQSGSMYRDKFHFLVPIHSKNVFKYKKDGKDYVLEFMPGTSEAKSYVDCKKLSPLFQISTQKNTTLYLQEILDITNKLNPGSKQNAVYVNPELYKREGHYMPYATAYSRKYHKGPDFYEIEKHQFDRDIMTHMISKTSGNRVQFLVEASTARYKLESSHLKKLDKSNNQITLVKNGWYPAANLLQYQRKTSLIDIKNNTTYNLNFDKHMPLKTFSVKFSKIGTTKFKPYSYIGNQSYKYGENHKITPYEFKHLVLPSGSSIEFQVIEPHCKTINQVRFPIEDKKALPIPLTFSFNNQIKCLEDCSMHLPWFVTINEKKFFSTHHQVKIHTENISFFEFLIAPKGDDEASKFMQLDSHANKAKYMKRVMLSMPGIVDHIKICHNSKDKYSGLLSMYMVTKNGAKKTIFENKDLSTLSFLKR